MTAALTASSKKNTVLATDALTGTGVPPGHIYWTTDNATGVGTIGEANPDGTGVNQNFITVNGALLDGVAVGP